MRAFYGFLAGSIAASAALVLWAEWWELRDWWRDHRKTYERATW